MPSEAHDTALLERELRDRGMRVTRQRLAAYEAMGRLGRHVTAEEVLSEVPSASLPTVYATLELFEELGVVRRVRSSGGAALYDPRTDAHHHLECRRCGRVQDIEAPADLSAALRAARDSGFEPDAADLVVSGVCAACRAPGA